MTDLPTPVLKAFKDLPLPDKETFAFSFDGWYLYGGNVTDPKPVDMDVVYISVLRAEGAEPAQDVLDKAKEQCGKLRLAMKSRRLHYSEGLMMQKAYDRLKEQLALGREAKKTLVGSLV